MMIDIYKAHFSIPKIQLYIKIEKLESRIK